jgi:hypothetical protein
LSRQTMPLNLSIKIGNIVVFLQQYLFTFV